MVIMQMSTHIETLKFKYRVTRLMRKGMIEHFFVIPLKLLMCAVMQMMS